LQDVLSDSALYHATVFPLKNIRSKLGTNYDAIRNIVRDSIRVDQSGAYHETLKWIAYLKWQGNPSMSPAFNCPHCDKEVPGLPYDADQDNCPHCHNVVYLSDMIGFHLDMDENSAPDSISSAYMLVMETLMLFTAIRFYWDSPDPN
jgi:hypothetical protein